MSDDHNETLTTQGLVDLLSDHLVWDEDDHNKSLTTQGLVQLLSKHLTWEEDGQELVVNEGTVALDEDTVVLDEGTVVTDKLKNADESVYEMLVSLGAPAAPPSPVGEKQLEFKKRGRKTMGDGEVKKPRKGGNAVKTSYKPRTERKRTTHSHKFKTVMDEVHQRLYGPPKNKLDMLVRTCHAKFGDAWVPWEAVKAVGAEVGYSKSSNIFVDTWVLRCSRYGRNSETVGCSEPFGLNFPYWSVEAREVNHERRYFVQLSPEFFVRATVSV
jgi:hypothetical protein